MGFINEINSKGTRNLRIVRVRKMRECNGCKKPINAEEYCLTVNPKSKARYWVCLDCVQSKLDAQEEEREKERLVSEYNRVKYELEHCIGINFDDEGGYYALQNYLVELERDMDKANLV